MTRHIFLLAAILLVGACSTLPRDGPSNRAITGAAATDAGQTFALVDLDYAMSERLRLAPAPILDSLILASSQEASDVIEVGDTLSVSIFEPGGAVFGGGSAGAGAPGTTTQALPALIVNRDGGVTIPFAGAVRVVGLTPQQAEQAIRRSLVGRIISPQVIVAVPEAPSNGVTIIGSIARPSRVPITANTNSILDVVAAAGGALGPPENILVSITRDGQTVTAPLSAVYASPAENIRLSRGDQINLISRPRRFSSFGALDAITLTEIPAGGINLTGALSRLGGLDNSSSNARAVMVFRFERPEVARAIGVAVPGTSRGVPVVYRLNFADPAGFFIANNFAIEADDVIYVPRADSAELGKFFELVRTLTGVISDVTIAGRLGSN